MIKIHFYLYVMRFVFNMINPNYQSATLEHTEENILPPTSAQ
jgi:hypothetical protein